MRVMRMLVDSPVLSKEVVFTEDHTSSGLTVLVGPNGGGKTTLLSILRNHCNFLQVFGVQAQKRRVEPVEEFWKHHIENSYFSAKGTGLDLSNWRFLPLFGWMGDKFRVELDFSLDNHDNLLFVKIEHEIIDRGGKEQGVMTKIGLVVTESPTHPYGGEDTESNLVMRTRGFYEAYHELITAQPEEIWGEIDEINGSDWGYLGEIPSVFFEKTRRLDGIREGASPMDHLVMLINEGLIDEIHQDFDFDSGDFTDQELEDFDVPRTLVDASTAAVGVEEAFMEITRRKLNINWDNQWDPEAQQKSEHLTSGQQHLVLLLMKILSRDSSQIILIDEIEISMHEEYIRGLDRWMKGAKMATLPQMIVTTHSPLFAGLNLENTVFVDNIGALE